MEKTIFKVDLSNSPWDSACFRSKVVGTKEVIYKLMETQNGSSVDSEEIEKALFFLSHLEKAVPLVNGCTPADSVKFPKIDDPTELVQSFLPEDFFWIPEYTQVAENLFVSDTIGKGLFFYGGTGRGMTTLLYGLAQWLKENQYPYIFDQSFSWEVKDFMNNFQEGIIIFDNVNEGWESVHSFKDILDRVEKSRGKFRVFAASRLSAASFVNNYGSRCASILSAVCARIEFKGDNLREEVDLNW